MSKVKYVRFGHHDSRKNGVVITATEIMGDKLFYGVAYSSPRDIYNKKLGRDMANHRLADAKRLNKFELFNEPLTHENVMRHLTRSLLSHQEYPRWAEDLLVKAYEYPYGLIRWDGTDVDQLNGQGISKIVVSSEEVKDQLIRTFKYLHDLRQVDTNFLMVSSLVHHYLAPDTIEVQS